MKRLLVYFLLIANLCSGLAFAWDTHPEAMVGHDTVMVDLVAGVDHDHPDGDLHHGDHCCHGISHLIGMFYDASTPVAVADCNHQSSLVSVSPLPYITPLLRPPIV